MSTNPHIPVSRSVAFPDLEPVGNRRRARGSRALEFSPRIDLIHESALDEETSPELREEPRNEVARLTVYVMNLIVMFISFPIGMAVLILNILGGENLRTTAHAIALAGMVTALSLTDLGQAILGPL